MTRTKNLDYKILSALLENSKTSDRQLAKKIGVSQPTVTRRRARLEREVIDGYTAIPKWKKLGYELLAVTLVKTKLQFGSTEIIKNTIEKSMKWLGKQPNVIFGGECRGMGVTGIMFSVHKNYADLDKFLSNHKQELGNIVEDAQTIIVNLAGEGVYRPLHFKYLAKTLSEKKE